MPTSEFLRIAGGRGYALLKAESTYGADPTAAASDYVHLESFESKYMRSFQSTEARDAYGDGFMDVPTMAVMEFTGSSRLFTSAISSLGSDADASLDPHFDALLTALCGWTRLRDSAQDAIAYISSLTSHGSAWIDAFVPTQSAAAGLQHQIAGARAGWTLNFPAGAEAITLDFEGRGIVLSTVPGNANHPIVNYASAPHAIVKPTGRPFIGTGGTIRLSDGTNLYGGGSLGTPAAILRLLSASVAGGYSAVPQAGHGASAGAQRVDLEFDKQITTLAIEAVNPGASSEFHPQALMDNCTPVFLDLRYDKPGTATDHLQYFSQGQIVDVDMDRGSKTSLYNLTIKALSAQDLGDDDPVAGTTPGQVYTANAGGTLGPAVVHGSGFTQIGRSFLQVWTA